MLVLGVSLPIVWPYIIRLLARWGCSSRCRRRPHLVSESEHAHVGVRVLAAGVEAEHLAPAVPRVADLRWIINSAEFYYGGCVTRRANIAEKGRRARRTW